MISTDHSILMEKNPWRYQLFLKARNKMSDISDFCIYLSSALSGTVDEYVSENRCKTLPPYPVVPLQERNDMSELQMDLCRRSCWANTEPASVQFSHSVVSDSATPWIAARQASLSITNSRSLLKPMSSLCVRKRKGGTRGNCPFPTIYKE